MIEGVADRLGNLVSDVKILTQALVEGRLIVKDSCQKGRMRLDDLHKKNQAEYKAGLCLSEIEKGIARSRYLELIPLLKISRYFSDWWAIVPVWRERKSAPTLSYKGRSGRIYKPGQKIPLWESDK